MTTPSADESARVMTDHIRRQEPFSYWRFGDGAIECIYSVGGKRTCDNEVYSAELGFSVLDAAVETTISRDQVYWGDWRTATGGSEPRYIEHWDALVGASAVGDSAVDMLHYEALLLMRESDALVDFYRAVKEDKRKKLYIGADVEAVLLLNAAACIIERGGDVDGGVIRRHLEAVKPDVVLFGAGMAGLVAVQSYWTERERNRTPVTAIHLGSALDPLFHKATRARQLRKADAMRMLEDLL